MSWAVFAWTLLVLGLFFGLGWLVATDPEHTTYGRVATVCLIVSFAILDILH